MRCLCEFRTSISVLIYPKNGHITTWVVNLPSNHQNLSLKIHSASASDNNPWIKYVCSTNRRGAVLILIMPICTMMMLTISISICFSCIRVADTVVASCVDEYFIWSPSMQLFMLCVYSIIFRFICIFLWLNGMFLRTSKITGACETKVIIIALRNADWRLNLFICIPLKSEACSDSTTAAGKHTLHNSRTPLSLQQYVMRLPLLSRSIFVCEVFALCAVQFFLCSCVYVFLLSFFFPSSHHCRLPLSKLNQAWFYLYIYYFDVHWFMILFLFSLFVWFIRIFFFFWFRLPLHCLRLDCMSFASVAFRSHEPCALCALECLESREREHVSLNQLSDLELSSRRILFVQLMFRSFLVDKNKYKFKQATDCDDASRDM